MKSKCCRSRPRCAMCPVVLAARARAMQAPDDGDLFRCSAPRRSASCRRVSSMRSRGLTAAYLGTRDAVAVIGTRRRGRRPRLGRCDLAAGAGRPPAPRREVSLDLLRDPAMVILVVDDGALDSCPQLDRAQPSSIEGDDRLVVAVVDADEVVELSRGKPLRLVKHRRYRDSAPAARNAWPPAACRGKRSDAASRACHQRSVTVRRPRPCGDTPRLRPMFGPPHIGTTGGCAYVPVMVIPIVTEVPLALEPTTRDDFLGSQAAPRPTPVSRVTVAGSRA